VVFSVLAGGDMNRLVVELQQQLDALAQDGPTQAELARVKASARAGLLSALTSNGSMSGLLASYHAVTGSWRGVLQELNDVDTLTGPEVGEVVGQVFADKNRFTGLGLPL
jgi:predicted Zn-dependent peptidase